MELIRFCNKINTNVIGSASKLFKYFIEKYKPEENIKGKLIDHIKGKDELSKRLDNRMSNLRIASFSVNTYNRKMKNKLGYRGVTFRKSRNTYVARVYYENKYHISNSFKTAVEAAIAYNELAIKYYGSTAILNKVKTVIVFKD